tara:strand:- start:3808 stop:4107 length:300 start_codon:yes stop_codon:yes gene_type:complete
MEPSEMKLTLVKTLTDTETIREEESLWIALLGELNKYDAVPNHAKFLIRKERAKVKGRVIKHCECGGTWSHHHRARHFKSLKHKNWLTSEVVAEVLNEE